MTAFRNRFTASRGEPPESDSIPLVIPPGNYVDTQAQQQAAAALETQRLADLEAQRLAGLETQRQADLEDQRLAQTQGAADYEAFIASPEGIINQSVAPVTAAPQTNSFALHDTAIAGYDPAAVQSFIQANPQSVAPAAPPSSGNFAQQMALSSTPMPVSAEWQQSINDFFDPNSPNFGVQQQNVAMGADYQA